MSLKKVPDENPDRLLLSSSLQVGLTQVCIVAILVAILTILCFVTLCTGLPFDFPIFPLVAGIADLLTIIF